MLLKICYFWNAVYLIDLFRVHKIFPGWGLPNVDYVCNRMRKYLPLNVQSPLLTMVCKLSLEWTIKIASSELMRWDINYNIFLMRKWRLIWIRGERPGDFDGILSNYHCSSIVLRHILSRDDATGIHACNRTNRFCSFPTIRSAYLVWSFLT